MDDVMRLAILLAASIFAACALSCAATADATLSAMAQSMRPEVERGQAAGFACTIKHPSDVVAGQQCIDHEVDKNASNKTLSPGFTIGAYVESVMGTSLKVGVITDSQAKGGPTDGGNSRMNFFASEIYRLQTAAGLSDAELCAITKKNCDALISALKTRRGGF
jgi:hypothetical protein